MLYLEKYLELDRCPHCRVSNPSAVQIHITSTRAYDDSDFRYWGLYCCLKCGGAIIASSYEERGIVIEMFPQSIEIDSSLPEKAKSFLHQAVESLHAPSGAIMLAASAIDAMLKEKGYKKGKLYPRINKASEDHLITKEMAEWAHEVRLNANDERHADENAELPKRDDAEKTVNFALALAEFLFVLPSKVQRGIKNATKANEAED